jgi:8-oxo-dGTP pyrophosphatase MutT (NUDIX family)
MYQKKINELEKPKFAAQPLAQVKEIVEKQYPQTQTVIPPPQKQAVMSYGVILYRDKSPLKDSSIKSQEDISSRQQVSTKVIREYLLIRRKDTVSYVVFIRGLYTRDMLSILAERMTQEERKNIETCSFIELWDKLWQHHPSKKHLHRQKFQKQFDRAKQRFERRDWVGIFNNVKCPYVEPEWGFPKGRGNKMESPLKAAIREFCEETGYAEKDIVIDKTITPFIERYTATDSKDYEIHYYLAKIKDPKKKLPIIDKNFRSSEISSIGWFTKESAINTIRDYNIEKINILKSL